MTRSGFSFSLHTDAGSHSESGRDSGKYGDEDVEDFTPEFFVFHEF